MAEEDAVSPQALIRIRDSGGILLGAYRGCRLVGFVLSIKVPELPVQHSHMLAVLPEARGLGIGLELKWAQYQKALERGDEHIVWTFDPLEARNARINLHRLGAVCREYFPDFYGQTSSRLHAGIDTDRLLAEWRVGAEFRGAPEAAPRLEPTQVDPLLSVGLDQDGLPVPGRILSFRRGEGILLALDIPADIQELKARNLELARKWRQVTRGVLLNCIGEGFEVCDLVGRGLKQCRQLLLRRADRQVPPMSASLNFDYLPMRHYSKPRGR